jgi:hypothetical protein
VSDKRARVGITGSEASQAERLAIKRGVHKVVDSVVDGFIWHLNSHDFEPATPSQVVGRRFGRGQVVLEKALLAAFRRYAKLRDADVNRDLLDPTGGEVASRDEADTVKDPYRTITYRAGSGERGEQGLTVESVVLMEALSIYNEIVEMFHGGDADQVHELERIRAAFKARYRDLVEVETEDLSTERMELLQPRGVIETFLDWLEGVG